MHKRGQQITLPDQRGRHPCVRKISENAINEIKLHITSFPKIESHYCRKTSKKQYLARDLNITKMYELYQQRQKNIKTKTLSRLPCIDTFSIQNLI